MAKAQVLGLDAASEIRKAAIHPGQSFLQKILGGCQVAHVPLQVVEESLGKLLGQFRERKVLGGRFHDLLGFCPRPRAFALANLDRDSPGTQ